MTNDEIKALALSCGFTERPQENGEMDLNPYVYEFARKLLSKNDGDFVLIKDELSFILSQCEIMRQLGENETPHMYHYTINRFTDRIDGAVYLLQSLLGIADENTD